MTCLVQLHFARTEIMAMLVRRGLLLCPQLPKAIRTCTTPVLSQFAGHTSEHLNLPSLRKFCSTKPSLKRETVTINFVKPGGDKQSVQAKVGDNLLDVIVDNEVDIDGFGACEGTLACSTCHLIFKPDHFEQIDEKPTDEELDMLDLAYGLTDYSRLGCQVYVTKDMENWEVCVPENVADARDV